MRYGTDLPYGHGVMSLHTDAPRTEVATEQLQRYVYHVPLREIQGQIVKQEDVYKDPRPRCTWCLKVRVTKHDTWATLASGITEAQANKMLEGLRGRRFEGRPLYAVRIGPEVQRV